MEYLRVSLNTLTIMRYVRGFTVLIALAVFCIVPSQAQFSNLVRSAKKVVSKVTGTEGNRTNLARLMRMLEAFVQVRRLVPALRGKVAARRGTFLRMRGITVTMEARPRH